MMGEVLKAVLLSLSMLDKLENDVFETFKDSEYPKSWMYKQIRQSRSDLEDAQRKVEKLISSLRKQGTIDKMRRLVNDLRHHQYRHLNHGHYYESRIEEDNDIPQPEFQACYIPEPTEEALKWKREVRHMILTNKKAVNDVFQNIETELDSLEELAPYLRQYIDKEYCPKDHPQNYNLLCN